MLNAILSIDIYTVFEAILVGGQTLLRLQSQRIKNLRRQCGQVVRTLALRSGVPGFKTRSDHNVEFVTCSPWLNFAAALPTLVRVFLCPCVGPFPLVGLTLTWFIWDRNLALHITLYSVNSV